MAIDVTVDKTSNLWTALIAARQSFDSVVKEKTGQVGNRKYSYADIGNVLDAVQDALNDNGVYVYQSPIVDESGVFLKSMLVHAATGEMIADRMPLPMTTDMQALGSAITYARRYMLMSQLGLAGEDDDGHSATQAARQRPAQQRRPAQHQELDIQKGTAPVVATPEDEMLNQEDFDVIKSWRMNPANAQEWSVEIGASENIHNARQAWNNVIQRAEFKGKWSGNEHAVMRAFYIDRILRKEEKGA